MTQGRKYKLQPRLIKGFRDIFAETYLARQWMIEQVRSVYEKYGFVPLETPALEYVDNLGKHIQETDSAEEGIFAFRDDDEELIALRYDLTAPLSRVFAQYSELTRPFRRYQLGTVWRDEKPGLGRFREFYQFDIDIVGSNKMSAEAEICSVICECMEKLNIKRGEYLVRVSNRKIVNAVMESCGIDHSDEKGNPTFQCLTTLRAIDKLDRLGMPGVIDLLGKGRKDETGDFTKGAELTSQQIDCIQKYLSVSSENRQKACDELLEIVKDTEVGQEGIDELRQIDDILQVLEIGEERVVFDPTIVRGLNYYTGPVFETVLTSCKNEKGEEVGFGSVFSGGRYDGLIERFTGQKVPATGASIGLDRLLEALKISGRIKQRKATAQVFVTTMDKNLTAEYHKLAHSLREAGLNTELFMGKGKLNKQLKYADRWDIPVALLLGSNELEEGTVSIKDLYHGREIATEIADREVWRKEQPAQVTVSRENLVTEIKNILEKYGLN